MITELLSTSAKGGESLPNFDTGKPEAEKSPYGRASGTTGMDYLNAFKEAHGELNRLLKASRSRWPRSKILSQLN